MATANPTAKSELLVLPLEIRLKILGNLLLTRNTPRAPTFDPTIPHTSHIRLLSLYLVCRQLYLETKDVFHRQNRFVHIVTNYDYLSWDLNAAGIPCLASGRAAKYFAHYCLKALLISHGYRPIGIHHIMIAGEDVERICSVIRILGAFRGCSLTIEFELLRPFPDMVVSRKVQELFIEPFRELRRLYLTISDLELDEGWDHTLTITLDDGKYMQLSAESAVNWIEALLETSRMLSCRQECVSSILGLTDARRICAVIFNRPKVSLKEGSHKGEESHAACAGLYFNILTALARAYSKLEQWHVAAFYVMEAIFKGTIGQHEYPGLRTAAGELAKMHDLFIEVQGKAELHSESHPSEIWWYPLTPENLSSILGIQLDLQP